jgi:kynurenine 3-monooxygenase
MNACFEDCRLLNETLDAHAGKDWATIFEAFQHHRKPDADAIADLAMDNFLEMRDKTADPVFVKKRQLELQLEEQYPDQFFSKYRMVTFSHRPYSEALRLGRLQDEILMDICREVETIEALDLAQVFERVQRERQTRSAALVES